MADTPETTGSGKDDGSQNTTPNPDPALPELPEETIIASDDWRVRLALASHADYLYKSPDVLKADFNILKPLSFTNGVIFPYMPTISMNYVANYDMTHPTHSNYPIFNYSKSGIEQVTITGDFTAQNVYEANYLLAVIHFFRSLTKMFYGQDENPKPGTPPPMVFLYGLGDYQFNQHPLVVNNFNYSLPNNVDYIKAYNFPSGANGMLSGPKGISIQGGTLMGNGKPVNLNLNESWGTKAVNATASAISSTLTTAKDRLSQGIVKGLGSTASTLLGNLLPGGKSGGASVGGSLQNNVANFKPGTDATYVPTQMQITLSCYPVVNRLKTSYGFSLKDYANGSLYKGGYW